MIYKSEITTTVYGVLGRTTLPVFFTDSFRGNNNDLYNLAYCSPIGGFSPYLFCGYFYGEKINKWYFSNARRHEEMEEAIKNHLKRSDLGYVDGQLFFKLNLLEEGELKFTSIILHSDLPNNRAKVSLLGVIDKEYICNDFEFRRARF